MAEETATLIAKGKWSEKTTWSNNKVPTAETNVRLPSGLIELKIQGAAAKCLSLVAEPGYTGTVLHETEITIGGSLESPSNIALKLISGMTFTSNSSIILKSSSGKTEKLYLGGREIGKRLEIAEGKGIFEEPFKGEEVEVLGTSVLNTNGQAVTVKKVSIGESATITLGTSAVTLEGTSGTVWKAENGSTVNAEASTIIVTNTGTEEKVFQGRTKKYGTLTIKGNNVVIEGNNTIETLNVETARATKSCKGTVSNVSEHFTVAGSEAEEANLSVGVELEGTGIVKGTIILSKVSGGGGTGIWEMSEKGTEIASPTATIYPVGLLLKNGEFQNLEKLTANGKAGELARIASTKNGTSGIFFWKKPATIILDYMRIKDNEIGGGVANCYAGAHSVLVSNDVGWKFAINIITAALKFVPSIPRTINQKIAAILKFEVSYEKLINHAIEAGLLFKAELGKLITYVRSAALGFSKELPSSVSHKVSSLLSFTGSIAKQQISLSITAKLPFVGSLNRSLITKLSSTLKFEGLAKKQISLSLSSKLPFVGSLSYPVTKTIGATLNFVGALRNFKIVHQISATLGLVVDKFLKSYTQPLSATLNFIGSVSRNNVTIPMKAALSFFFSGEFIKKYVKVFEATLGFAGSTGRSVLYKLTGFLPMVGSERRLIAVPILGKLSFSGFANKRFIVTLIASIKNSGELGRSVVYGILGSLKLTGGLLNAVTRPFTATLKFVGKTSKVAHEMILKGTLKLVSEQPYRFRYIFTRYVYEPDQVTLVEVDRNVSKFVPKDAGNQVGLVEYGPQGNLSFG